MGGARMQCFLALALARIAPGALKVENGIAVAEFRDRGPGAAMASEPTIARVARYRLFSGVLQVAAQ